MSNSTRRPRPTRVVNWHRLARIIPADASLNCLRELHGWNANERGLLDVSHPLASNGASVAHRLRALIAQPAFGGTG